MKAKTAQTLATAAMVILGIHSAWSGLAMIQDALSPKRANQKRTLMGRLLLGNANEEAEPPGAVAYAGVRPGGCGCGG
jgi:hypothetical protein